MRICKRTSIPRFQFFSFCGLYSASTITLMNWFLSCYLFFIYVAVSGGCDAVAYFG
jgi:hypothetical protein